MLHLLLVSYIYNMQTITDHIRTQLAGDITAQEALQRGILNLRAYGRSIRGPIETARGEKVDVATLAVSLSRLEKHAADSSNRASTLKLDDLTVRAPLVDITYPRNVVTTRELERITGKLHSGSENFIAVNQGDREITIIVPARHESIVTSAVDAKPIYVRGNLYAITVHFPVAYMPVPNVLYKLVAAVAAYRVNLIELVSTLTELSFVVDRDDVDTVTKALQQFL
jgi:hypothetical protein